MTNNEFIVSLSAMRVEELKEILLDDDTAKGTFQEAVSLFVGLNPGGFLKELKDMAENQEHSNTIRSRVTLFLIRKGYVPNHYPDEALDDLEKE